jgi:hypothetical protein
MSSASITGKNFGNAAQNYGLLDNIKVNMSDWRLILHGRATI